MIEKLVNSLDNVHLYAQEDLSIESEEIKKLRLQKRK